MTRKKFGMADNVLQWEGTVYYVYDCLLEGYQIDGLWLRGIVSQDQGTKQLQGLVRFSLIALPALLIFAVIGGYWIAGRALRPVARITQAAAQIGQGRIWRGASAWETAQMSFISSPGCWTT